MGDHLRSTLATGADRSRLLGVSALQVLAEAGSRGLTHRAVDARAGLPTGSVNYYVKTRDQLLALALDELFRHDYGALPVAQGPISDPRHLAGPLTHLVLALTTGQAAVWQRARFELLLEAKRRPEFDARFAAHRQAFVDAARAALQLTGCSTAEEHGETLVAFLDGLISARVLFGREWPGEQLSRALAGHLSGC